LNDLEGMKNIFMYYGWFCVGMLSVSGVIILILITLTDSNAIKAAEGLREFDMNTMCRVVTSATITSYLLYTLELNTTLTCYLGSVLFAYAVIGLGKLKQL